MSYTDLLIDTCTTKRFNDTGTGNYGEPTGTWDDELTSQACRLMTTTGIEVKVGAEVVVADYKLFLLDIGITERDRVVISSITYEVLLVSTRQDGIGSHHKECLLRTVR